MLKYFMSMMGLELTTPRLQTECSSHWAVQLKSYCWEGVEFIQLVYCIIIFLSFSNVIDFSSEKYSGSTGHRNSWYQWRNFQWGCRWWDPNSQPLDYKPSALAIELYSSKAIAGKELSLSSWCIESLYFYHFSTVIDFSSEKYSGSTGHRNSWYQ